MTELLERAVSALESIVKSLNDSNQTDVGLFWTNIALVIATIAFGAYSILSSERRVKKSEGRQEERFTKQAERQELEHFERVRPWITIEGFIPVLAIYENGDANSWDNFMNIPVDKRPKITHVKYNSQYKNVGIRVANDLREIALAKDEPITKQELQNQKEEDTHKALGPNQSQYKTLTITAERWLKITILPLYVGIQISYENGKTRSESGAIFKMIRGQSEIIETWYT